MTGEIEEEEERRLRECTERSNSSRIAEKEKKKRQAIVEVLKEEREELQNHDKNKKRKLADGKAIREEKHRKWLAKQQKRNNNTEESKHRGRDDWIRQNSHFVHRIALSDVKQIKEKQQQKRQQQRKNDPSCSSASSATSILEASLSSILEQLLHPYFNLQDGKQQQQQQQSQTKNQQNNENYFIAEGTETVRLLIQQQQQKQVVMNDTNNSSGETAASSSSSNSNGNSSNSNSSNSNNSRLLPPISIKSIFVKPSVFFDDPVSLIKDVNNIVSTATTAMDGSSKKKNGASTPANTSESLTTTTETAATSNNYTNFTLPSPLFHVLLGTTEDVLSEVAGFPISRGALACGVIPHPRDESWFFHTFLKKQVQSATTNTTSSLRLLALDACSDTANMGSIIRCASAFGIHAIILNQNCCDAWYRRSVRVSMGHIFRVPVVRVSKLHETLKKLSAKLSDNNTTVRSYAAVCDDDDDDDNANDKKELLILEAIPPGKVPKAWCCVMGNEADGISKQVRNACDHNIRIDMQEGIDSLSLPIATGILLHGLRERETKSN